MLIRNGFVIDPVSRKSGQYDLRIDGEKIIAVGDEGRSLPPLGEGERVLDAAGLTIAPGLMDTHVHFRDPGQTWKEDILTGAEAARRGGFTTVVCMANTVPAVDSPETLAYVLEKGRRTGVEVLCASAVTRGLQGKELVDMEQMAQSGAACFTDDGIPLMDASLLLAAMERARALDLPVSLHEEAPAFVPGPGVNAGAVAKKLGYPGAMGLAEEVMVARDCMLALESGARVVIQHISSGRSVELVRLAKRLGADIHAEATPHHFTLTEEAVLRWGTNARMNPPLRTEADRQAIIAGLKDGTIDLIVTDHAPHSAEEKAKPLAQAPSGIIGLETSLGLGIRSLVEPGHLTLQQLIEKMSVNPARVFGREPAGITPGARADLVLFDERGEWTVERFASKSANSPFLGWKLPGKVCYTVFRGQVTRYQQGQT